MWGRVAWLVMWTVGCGGASGSTSSSPDESADARNDGQLESDGVDTPLPGSSSDFPAETDSATRHCFRTQPAELPTPVDALVGCWRRTMVDGTQLSLDVFSDGRFLSSLDGGDVQGLTSGVWEASAGGLVLLPSPGECVLRDGNFDDACVRVFDTDLDPSGIRVAQQQGFDDVVSSAWQRADLCDYSFDLTPRDEGCRLGAIEPAGTDLEAIEIYFPSYPGDVGRGRLMFSTTADLSIVDLHDLQRNLVASVQSFSLRTLDGSAVAHFGWHVPGLSEAERSDPNRSPVQDETGEFRIQANRGLAVDFVHDLTALPDQLELHYEFEAAKYILDSGPRVARLPVTQ